jgi:hypothetical protein
LPRRSRTELCTLLLAGLCLLQPVWGQNSSATAVRRVQVLGTKDAVEIEIEASDRLVPQTHVLTGPDRLVVDFPNAVPGGQLRGQSVNRGEVKTVRVGLFQSNPPVTRVVLDLNSPQSFQVFPNGRRVIIKVTGASQQGPAEVDDFPAPTRPGLVTANYVAAAEPVRAALPAQPGLEVTFKDGLLTIRSNKATLSEVLFAVHQRTGADIAIAAGAEQERVVADIGPGLAPEVIASLLNGSRFNFMILGSASDPRMLDRVILSQRTGGPVIPSPANQDDADVEVSQPVPPSNVPPHTGHAVAPGQLPTAPPEAKAPDDNTPD